MLADILRCKTRGMPFMRSQCRDGIPPCAKSIHGNGKQLADLALSITHCTRLARNEPHINTG